MTGTPHPSFFPRVDVVKAGWTMICEILCGMFGVYLIDDAVEIRKWWENWEAEILSPSGKLGRKGTPEIRVQRREDKLHSCVCSRGDAETAEV